MTSAPELVLRPIPLASIARADWDRLVDRTPSATPFARWTFHRAWWDAYGESAREHYLVADDDAGAISAIVPLMHRQVADRDVIFFGASYHADYATILGSPGVLPAVASSVARVLSRWPGSAFGVEPWDAVDLRRLRPTDPALLKLDAAFRGDPGNWRVAREIEDVCPVVTVPGADWDEYLATLDKKARHEIRRKLRRASVVGDVSIDIVPPTADVIDLFIQLHQARFGEDGLFPEGPDGERSRTFIHRLAELERAEPDGGLLHVGLVRCGESLVFALLAFDDGMTCYLYNAGMDPAAAEASPGVTGTAAYLRDRMAAGRRRFDFLRGAEPYKYEWGARDEPIERLIVTRPAS